MDFPICCGLIQLVINQGRDEDLEFAILGSGAIQNNLIPAGANFDIGRPDRRWETGYFRNLDVDFGLFRNLDVNADDRSRFVVNSASIDFRAPAMTLTSDHYVNINTPYVNTDNIQNSDGVLTLDEVSRITPRAGQPYACNSSHYGEIIFSTSAIGANNPANSFYGCTAIGWRPL